MFENFPYTNFHDLNMDWILQKVKELAAEFAALNKDNAKFKSDTTAALAAMRAYIEERLAEVIDQEYIDQRINAAVAEIAEEVYHDVIEGGHMFDYITLTSLTPITSSGKMTIDYACTYQGPIYIVEFPKPAVLEYLPASGNYATPRDTVVPLLEFYKNNPKFDIVFNAGQTGNSVFNGVGWETSPDRRTGSYYLAFNATNDPVSIPRINQEGSMSALMQYQNVIPIWSPIMENGVKFNYEQLPHIDDDPVNYSYIYKQCHIRTVLVCDTDKWAVIIFDGRGTFGRGYSYDDLYAWLSTRGYQNAYNLDGGGSSQCFIGGVPLTVGMQNYNYREMWSVIGVVI